MSQPSSRMSIAIAIIHVEPTVGDVTVNLAIARHQRFVPGAIDTPRSAPIAFGSMQTRTSNRWDHTSRPVFEREAYEGVVMRRVFDPDYVAALGTGWCNLKTSIEQHGVQRQARFL